MVVGRAAKAAAGNVRALGLGLSRDLGCRRGNVRDALVRRGGPLSAEEILLVLWLVKIVRHRIESPERCVVIADAGDVVVVGVNILRADGRWFPARSTTRQRPGGQSA